MTKVGMHEAKTRLSQLVHEVETGGEVVIARNGQPVARLVRIEPGPARGFGAMSGCGRIVDLTWDDIVAGDAEVDAHFDGHA